jgi:hypothetical protein
VRAAYSLILKQRRAAVRHPANVTPSSASLTYANEDRPLRNTIIFELSRLGMGLGTKGILPQGATVRCEFTLPQTEHLIRVVGTVVWSHISGRSGIKFEHLGREDRDKLDQWSQCQTSQGW